MRKFLALLLSLSLAVSLAACGSETSKKDDVKIDGMGSTHTGILKYDANRNACYIKLDSETTFINVIYREDEDVKTDELWFYDDFLINYNEQEISVKGDLCYYEDLTGSEICFCPHYEIISSSTNSESSPNVNYENDDNTDIYGLWYSEFILHYSGGMKYFDGVYFGEPIMIYFANDGSGAIEGADGSIYGFDWWLTDSSDSVKGQLKFDVRDLPLNFVIDGTGDYLLLDNYLEGTVYFTRDYPVFN